MRLKFIIGLVVCLFVSTNSIYCNDEWDFRNETIYFIITDRFVDGDKNNNDIYGDEYKPGNLRYYQGGDFKGVIENLDYIKEMGFTALWITPVVMQPPGRYLNSSKTYDAAGYHGYWGWDFSKIDPHLESPGYTYKDLINAAHKKGIKIIQDIVLNHGHGGDVDVSVKWYEDRGKVFGLGRVFDFFNDKENWFNHEGPVLFDLLDFNDKNQQTRKWLIDIYKYYQDMGVDAFRLDTVIWVSSDFVKEFCDEMHRNKKDFFIFGEVWTNSDIDLLSSYTKLSTSSLKNSGMSVVDMPLSAMGNWGPLEKVFKGGSWVDADKILKNDNKYNDPTYLITFLDNHDKPRFNGNEKGGSKASLSQYIDALNFYFTARGIFAMYYGTEIMLDGGEDPDNRKYFGIEGIKKAKTHPLFSHIKKLNAIRRKSIALMKGRMESVYVSKDVYAFKRIYNDEIVYVILNKSDKEKSITINLPPSGYMDLLTDKSFIISDIQTALSIPPHYLKIIKKQ